MLLTRKTGVDSALMLNRIWLVATATATEGGPSTAGGPPSHYLAVINMKWKWHVQRDWGRTTLGIWLVATGVLPLLGIVVPHGGQLLAILAIAAGILILMGR